METGFQKLQEENERLSRLAERDWLTGLYNRGATETRINQSLQEREKGLLFVLDVDNFKQVNDRYGHITGDETLREIARVLGSMAFREDVIGRVGGDEFVIYMPVEESGAFLEDRCRQLRSRLSEIQPGRAASSRISVTVSGSAFQPGDDYIQLFDRADQRLLERKRRRKRNSGETSDQQGIGTDVRRICGELKELALMAGAYCQDYDTFKSIFRFVERRLRRTQGSAFIILFTVMDRRGDFPPLAARERQMDTLQGVIQTSLRLGDVFTQYTSCQYLVLVSDLTQDDADMVAERIRNAFYRETDAGEDRILLHHCYPMSPVEAG